MQNGETEIAQNEAKLADARKEYEDGKETSEEEIAKGEKKLADAKEQIKKIKNPKWYVYNRSTLVEYDGFGENANRMRAIGKVFPVMFFLVAALISLTGMTRMVEEQRIEIGTMKALGYLSLIHISPAAPTTAPELGKSLSDPIKMYLGDIYTISVNLAGLPGITIPVGKDSKGLPVGMQLIGNCFEENKIIQTAYTFEQTKAYEAPELAKEDR